MSAMFSRVWICVVYASVCAFLALAFLTNALLGQWPSLIWAAAAITGLVYSVRQAQRLHRQSKQQDPAQPHDT